MEALMILKVKIFLLSAALAALVFFTISPVFAEDGGVAPATALATAVTSTAIPTDLPDQTIGEVVEALGGIFGQFRAGNFALAVGAILFVLAGLLRRFWDFIPSDWKPYAIAGASVVTSIGAGLAAGAGVLSSIYMGIVSAGFATLLWALTTPLRKRWPWLDRILRGQFSKPKAAPPAA
jgi:hypothetical protein